MDNEDPPKINEAVTLFGVVLLIVLGQWVFKITEGFYKSVAGRSELNEMDYVLVSLIIIIIFILVTKIIFHQPVTQFF